MAGRNPHPDDRRTKGGKKVRGFARGHGAHHRHRPGKEAPRVIGTGRDRTIVASGARASELMRLGDEELENLASGEKTAAAGKRLEELEGAQDFGAPMEGAIVRGTVIEVRKGNFLTRIRTAGILPASVRTAGIPPASVPLCPSVSSVVQTVPSVVQNIRTFVRGTLQQFDRGLSSLVAPGDEVEVIIAPLAGENELQQWERHAMLTRALPRRSEFRRMHPSGRSIQTLAANVDRVFIVTSASEPDFRPGFVDRVLVCAASSNIPAALILNKIDLGVKPADEELLRVYQDLGVEVFRISVADASAPQGDFEALKARLAGSAGILPASASEPRPSGSGPLADARGSETPCRTLLAGHSGVGKSSLLLALDRTLTPETVRVGDVSTQTQKGTHTTTHARLYSLDLGGGLRAEVVDTPGVREFTPADTDRRNLWGWFPEIARLQGQCEFPNCAHIVEKGCAVLAAVERGEIHPRRHQSYARIYETLPT